MNSHLKSSGRNESVKVKNGFLHSEFNDIQAKSLVVVAATTECLDWQVGSVQIKTIFSPAHQTHVSTLYFSKTGEMMFYVVSLLTCELKVNINLIKVLISQ